MLVESTKVSGSGKAGGGEGGSGDRYQRQGKKLAHQELLSVKLSGRTAQELQQDGFG